MSSVHKGPVMRNPREMWEKEEDERRKKVSGEAHLQALESLVRHQKDHERKIEALEEGQIELAQSMKLLESSVTEIKANIEAIAGLVRKAKKETDVQKDAP